MKPYENCQCDNCDHSCYRGDMKPPVKHKTTTRKEARRRLSELKDMLNEKSGDGDNGN